MGGHAREKARRGETRRDETGSLPVAALSDVQALARCGLWDCCGLLRECECECECGDGTGIIGVYNERGQGLGPVWPAEDTVHGLCDCYLRAALGSGGHSDSDLGFLAVG